MPTYEYRRNDGTTFEVFQRITDAPLTEDPETGQQVERVISGGAGLQFKGTGFYLTDYGRAGAEVGSSNGTKDGGDSSGPKVGEKVDAKSGDNSEGKTESSTDTASTVEGTKPGGDSSE